MKSKHFAFGILLIVVSTGFILYQGQESGNVPNGIKSELLDSNQAPVNINQFKGKVVFINNWASWCPPCIAEMPSIQNLKNTFKDENIVFLMISYDNKPEKALQFIQKKNFDFEVYFPGDNYPFHTESIPATFILDKNGNVVASHSGMANFNDPAVIKKIKDLIK